MTTVPIPLDRIVLDDLAICPRSSMLRELILSGPRPQETDWVAEALSS